MKKHKTKIIWGAVIVALLGLMYWGGGASSAATWEETDVSCIPGGHQNLAYHIHADLLVSVDGEGQTIPTNTGISSSCMAEVHTHNQTGYIHAESVDRDSIQTLGDFFAVWGEQTEREGYEAVVMVNGEESSFEYQFRDGDDIQVSFNSEGDKLIILPRHPKTVYQQHQRLRQMSMRPVHQHLQTTPKPVD